MNDNETDLTVKVIYKPLCRKPLCIEYEQCISCFGMTRGEANANRERCGAKVVELRERVNRVEKQSPQHTKLLQELADAEIDYSIALGIEDVLTPDWIVVKNGFLYNSRPHTHCWQYLSMEINQ